MIWKIKKGFERRVKSGHPWVYSHEIEEIPKRSVPGALVELQDYQGNFLARGYGNPLSQISFRVLSFDPQDLHPFSESSIAQKILKASRLRHHLGLSKVSHRLIHGEADFFPGLIMDRFITENFEQIFVVQAHTAGADNIVLNISSILKEFVKLEKDHSLSQIDWSETHIAIRNDINMRKLEGLNVDEPKALRTKSTVDLSQVKFRIQGQDVDEILLLTSDLLQGQKTGFFLDQSQNTRLVRQLLKRVFAKEKNRSLKILDICTYVGQWSSQLSCEIVKQGLQAECTLLDISQRALNFAKINAESVGALVTPIELDVFKGFDQFNSESESAARFDVVICDPPALAKGKKDLPQALHAYMKLNENAMKTLKDGGIFISCSCSGVVSEEDFSMSLQKASRRANKTIHWVMKGGQALDHPVLSSFPEGRYLKCWIGVGS